MVNVEEATIDHFDAVYLLLRQLNDTTISKTRWKTCFINPFKDEIGHAGYVLKDKEQIVGFFGGLFSTRTIKGTTVKFCNCHSWIVLPEYRSKGLLLLNRIHKLKDHILTNFSASDGPYQIMKQLGWKEKEVSYSIIWRPLFSFSKNGVVVKKLSENESLAKLTKEEKEIVHHHRSFNCQLLLLESNGNHCLTVGKGLPYKPGILQKIKLDSLLNLRLGQMYYISDPEFFFRNFETNLSQICKTNGWAGLIISDKYVMQYKLPINRKYLKRRPILYRTRFDFNEDDLDLLYSELFVLDLN